MSPDPSSEPMTPLVNEIMQDHRFIDPPLDAMESPHES